MLCSGLYIYFLKEKKHTRSTEKREPKYMASPFLRWWTGINLSLFSFSLRKKKNLSYKQGTQLWGWGLSPVWKVKKEHTPRHPVGAVPKTGCQSSTWNVIKHNISCDLLMDKTMLLRQLLYGWEPSINMRFSCLYFTT